MYWTIIHLLSFVLLREPQKKKSQWSNTYIRLRPECHSLSFDDTPHTTGLTYWMEMTLDPVGGGMICGFLAVGATPRWNLLSER